MHSLHHNMTSLISWTVLELLTVIGSVELSNLTKTCTSSSITEFDYFLMIRIIYIDLIVNYYKPFIYVTLEILLNASAKIEKK